MKINKTNLDGVFLIENKKHEDQRGLFVKTFHQNFFIENGLDYNFKESFYSVSRKNVLRGMHFQLPPHDHSKLVYVTEGEILDVVVDIRVGSINFGHYFHAKLSSTIANSIYIPKGFAHGFLTLSNTATVVYLTTSEHNEKFDTGIRWDSFGFDWPQSGNLIISDRDKSFKTLPDYL